MWAIINSEIKQDTAASSTRTIPPWKRIYLHRNTGQPAPFASSTKPIPPFWLPDIRKSRISPRFGIGHDIILVDHAHAFGSLVRMSQEGAHGISYCDKWVCKSPETNLRNSLLARICIAGLIETVSARGVDHRKICFIVLFAGFGGFRGQNTS